ncbi:hypothetical protein [Clostridium nigeriense]|uniref:hypothetical protein n=1 Tax=Clostridium nigeriense TaxID=1805470 RepID=UPI00083308D5|nr:hypothetical protein [Clostridium nigeriense]
MKEKNTDILLKVGEEKLLRFSYSDELGIYYEIINKCKIIKRKIIFRNSFKYFFVTLDVNRNINLICQDEVGNIILCILIEGKWKYKILFHMKYNFITPIKAKGFFNKKELKILFNLDSDYKNIYYSDNYKSLSTIYNDNNDIDIDYDILENYKYVSLIINSVSFNIYKLIFKNFNKDDNIWSNNEIIYISRKDYIDKSYCLVNNKIHFLIVTQEENEKLIVYKNITLCEKEELTRETIIFNDENIDSCLIIESKEVLWTFWISKNKLFGSYSVNEGEDFSSPLVYKIFKNEDVRKIKFIEGNKSREVYFYEEDGKIRLFLEDILKVNEVKFNINYKSISCGLDIKDEKIIDNDKIKKSKEFEDKQRKYTINY